MSENKINRQTPDRQTDSRQRGCRVQTDRIQTDRAQTDRQAPDRQTPDRQGPDRQFPDRVQTVTASEHLAGAAEHGSECGRTSLPQVVRRSFQRWLLGTVLFQLKIFFL